MIKERNKMVTKKQKAKERKATIIFIACLFGVIALITIIAVVAQVEENKKPKEEPVEPETCLRGVFYTDEKDGKAKFQPLNDGLCVKDQDYNMGECSRVDGYGVCYDSNNNVKREATLYTY